LVRDFLLGSNDVHTELTQLKDHEMDYGGFSLICFDFGKNSIDMAYITNRENQSIINLESGVIYGKKHWNNYGMIFM
jgi:hypothetical protein